MIDLKSGLIFQMLSNFLGSLRLTDKVEGEVIEGI
ncbi:hypothetical protein Gorai_006232, partial [Gossypium raimondii]|nr:hypothetical protein [Gossypium raimondii]